MRTRMWLSLVPLCLLSVATAQTPPEREGSAQPPAGRRAPREARQAGDRPMRGPGMEMLTRRLSETLELDEQQQQQFDALAADFRKKQESGDGAQMGELMREMREARESGDTAKVAELEEQFGALRKAATEQRNVFLDSVEKILHPDQVQKLTDFRQRMAEREARGPGGPGGPGGPEGRGGPGRMLDQLREDLKLDESQAAKFDELAASLREQMRQGRGGNEGVRNLRRELREAEDAGDEKRVEELRRQLAELGGDPRALMNEFYAQIEPILNAEQKQTLAEARQRAERGRDGRGGDDVRGLLRTARRLELTEEQGEQLREIEAEGRKLDTSDREAMSRAVAELKAKIIAILTPEQAKEFEKQLNARGDRERAGRRGEGRGGEGRGAEGRGAEGRRSGGGGTP